jgi:hypothetical protein
MPSVFSQLSMDPRLRGDDGLLISHSIFTVYQVVSFSPIIQARVNKYAPCMT